MSCNALQCLPTTKAYNKDREGAANQAWFRARAKLQRQRLVKKVLGWSEDSKKEIAMLKEAQKEAYNKNNPGSRCKQKQANYEEALPIWGDLLGGVLKTPRA